MAQEAVVINIGDSTNTDSSKEKKSDTLFGPNIGIVGGGPEWTERHEKSTDELTPEVIKSWISKSKEVCPSPVLLIRPLRPLCRATRPRRHCRRSSI